MNRFQVETKLQVLSEIFPVSANVFGDAAIDAMGSAYEVLALSSINIEKHQEFEAKLVSGGNLPLGYSLLRATSVT